MSSGVHRLRVADVAQGATAGLTGPRMRGFDARNVFASFETPAARAPQGAASQRNLRGLLQGADTYLAP